MEADDMVSQAVKITLLVLLCSCEILWARVSRLALSDTDNGRYLQSVSWEDDTADQVSERMCVC